MSMQQNAGRRRGRRRGSKRLRVAIAIIAAVMFVAMGVLWFYSSAGVISPLWVGGATAFFLAAGALFSFYQWILPLLPIDMKRDEVPPSYSQSEYVARPPRSASRPHKAAGLSPPWHVPHSRNWLFTGRDATLATLHKRLTDASMATLTQAVNGLGGTGKTQIALEYAYRYRAEYHMVGWLQADTRDTLMTDLSTLARLLNLPKQGGQDPSQMVVAYKQWCVEHKNWLLIFDNVNDVEMVREFLPVGGYGHILLTTRISALQALTPVIEVGEMSMEEGAELLLRRARLLARDAPLATVTDTDRRLAEQIVTLLGGLPLALDCAGAYIEESGLSLSECLNRYQHRRKYMLARRGTHKGMYPETVVTTWIGALREIKKVNAGAAALLTLCAFLAPEAIPEDMFKNGGAYLGRPLKSLFADDLIFDEAIAVIRRHSLLKRNHETRTLSIHRLVQAVLEDRMSERQRRRWAMRAIRLVYHALPAITLEALPYLQTYSAHIERCVELIDNYCIRTAEAVRLLHSRAFYLYLTGSNSQAEAIEALYQRVLLICEQVLGKKHLETVTVTHEFANFLKDQGRHKRAEELYQQVIYAYETSADSQSIDKAQAQLELARLSVQLNEQARAENLYQQVIRAYETSADSQSLDLAQMQLELARLLVQLNKQTRAEELYQQAIRAYETLPDSQPLDLAQAQLELARLSVQLTKQARAEELYQQVIHEYEMSAGSQPLDLAQVQLELARLSVQLTKQSQAEGLYRQVIEVYETLPAIDPLDLAQVQLEMAHLSVVLNKQRQAEELYQKVLTAYKTLPGIERLDRANIQLALASLYQTQEKYTEADAFYQEATDTFEKVMGEEHPFTLTALERYASLLKAMQKDTEATELMERIKKVREQ